jgi:hypothetical protein
MTIDDSYDRRRKEEGRRKKGNRQKQSKQQKLEINSIITIQQQ